MPFFDPAVAGQGGFYIPGANTWGGDYGQLPDEAVLKSDALVFADGVSHQTDASIRAGITGMA
jgi:hypothetical protein